MTAIPKKESIRYVGATKAGTVRATHRVGAVKKMATSAKRFLVTVIFDSFFKFCFSFML